MKTFFISLALVATTLSTTAQSSSGAAKKLLNEATAKLKSYDQLYIAFTYNFINTRVDPPVTQKEIGSIGLKGDDYHLNFLGTEQIRKGNKVYTILAEDEEVQITAYEPNEEEQGITPTALLSAYDKGYSYKLGGTEKKNGKTIEYVILKPNASEEVDKIMVGIEKETKHLYSLKQWGTNGTEVTFTITSFETNKKLPANYFTFNRNDYKGYYISE